MNISHKNSARLARVFLATTLLFQLGDEAAAQDVDVPSVTVIPLDSAQPRNTPQPRVVTPNTVAVLDLGIRREHRDFFYDEKFDQKVKLKDSMQAAVDIRSGQVSGDESRPSPQVFRQANMVNDDRREDAARDSARMAASRSIDLEGSTSYSRQYGFKRSLSYKELRGLMTDIRTALNSAGYSVRYVGPPNSKEIESGRVPTFIDRLQAGDFGDAEFVVIPNVLDISQRQLREPIQGTQDFSNRLELNISAEFAMVNTRDLTVVASFNATGSGSDLYIGRQSAVFNPDTARIVRDVISTFGEDSKRKLMARLPKPAVADSSGASSKSAASIDGDPKTLKIYKNSETKTDTKGGDRTVEQKTEIRVFR